MVLPIYVDLVFQYSGRSNVLRNQDSGFQSAIFWNGGHELFVPSTLVDEQ